MLENSTIDDRPVRARPWRIFQPDDADYNASI
jgi:hypothetical protein